MIITTVNPYFIATPFTLRCNHNRITFESQIMYLHFSEFKGFQTSENWKEFRLFRGFYSAVLLLLMYITEMTVKLYLTVLIS